MGKDKLITDYLVEFSLSQVRENKNWDPEKTLIEFIKEVNKEGVGDLIEQLNHYTISDFEAIKKQIVIVKKEYESTLKKYGENGLKLMHAKQLPATAFASGGSGIYNLFVKLSTLKAVTETELYGANVTKTLDENKWHSSKANVDEKAGIDSINTI